MRLSLSLNVINTRIFIVTRVPCGGSIVSKGSHVCFIDDDVDEICRFKDAMNGYFKVSYGRNLSESEEYIKNRKLSSPKLWILDMYMPSKSEFSSSKPDILKINRRYNDLNEHINRYRTFLTELKQDTSKAIDIHNKLKSKRRSIIYLTRKGTLEDALMALENGANGVLKKPMPNTSDWPQDPKAVKELLDTAFDDAKVNLRGKFNPYSPDRSQIW